MGGSFNPPTIAHLRIMQAALDQLPGDSIYGNKGIFVPASNAYVNRKMSKKLSEERIILSENLRLNMLESFKQHDSRISVDTRELGTCDVSAHTVQTLKQTQKENPDAEIYFIFGGDKMGGLSRWSSFEDLISQFKIIAFAREGMDPADIISSDKILCRYSDRFSILALPNGLDGISSSAVRNRMLHNGDMSDLLTHGVYTLLLAHLQQRTDAILCFQSENFFLSNFYEGGEFWWKGLPYRSAEAAFQSAKCVSNAERNRFSYLSPKEAKRKGRSIPLPVNWEKDKDVIMEDVVRAKFFQNPRLAKRLLSTKDMELIEGNTWEDTYWGVDLRSMDGQNRLGKILMKIRDELNSIPTEDFDFLVRPITVDASFNDKCIGGRHLSKE